MISFDCPWCEETATLPFPLPEDPEATFSCSECGVTVAWADEPAALDLAA